jgi:hypothetical protein
MRSIRSMRKFPEVIEAIFLEIYVPKKNACRRLEPLCQSLECRRRVGICGNRWVLIGSVLR